MTVGAGAGTVVVEGRCDPGLEPMRAAFAAAAEELDPGAAAMSAWVAGREVLSLRYRYPDDAMVTVFSATKGVLAGCCMMLADRGLLDPDQPVQAYWPEFRDARVLVRHVLNHSAGIMFVQNYRTFLRSDGTGFDQWDRICAELAGAEPLWEPGAAAAYHGLTIGWLAGEVFRRVEGRTVGRFLREEICDPHGLDLWIGVPPAEHARILPVVPYDVPSDGPALETHQILNDPDGLPGKMLNADEGGSILSNVATVFNGATMRASEQPWGNGVGSASALARFYDLLPSLVSAETLAAWTGDEALGPPDLGGSRWVLGFSREGDVGPLVPTVGESEHAFGHGGFGGQMGLHDPDLGLSFGFVRTRVSLTSQLGPELLNELYRLL